MVFGVDVAGERREAPPGNLDVWIRSMGLSEVAGMTEESIRDAIDQRRPVQHSTDFDLGVRIDSVEQAQTPIDELKGWVSANPHASAS